MNPLESTELPRLNLLQQKPVLKYVDPMNPGELPPQVQAPQAPVMPSLESALAPLGPVGNAGPQQPLNRRPSLSQVGAQLNPLPALGNALQRFQSWANERKMNNSKRTSTTIGIRD